jgi:hypothetical protein
MPETNAYMNAVDLLFTAQRIARLKVQIALAKDLGRAHDDEAEELQSLTALLEAHPIKCHIRTHSNLSFARFDRTMRERHGNYWCAIESDCRAHTAFMSPGSSMLWLEERGLTLSEPVPYEGPHIYQRLNGSYREALHSSYDVFYSLVGTRTREMSNGKYTMAIITHDDDGLRTVHTLNCNLADRPVYDYDESAKIYR